MTNEVKCPTCEKLSVWDKNNSFRPFCSERCQLIDLGDWASESHRIPVGTHNEDNFSEYEAEKSDESPY